MPSGGDDIRPARGPEDTDRVRRLVDDAFTPYIPRIGSRPMPMETDFDAVVAEGRCWVAVHAGRIVGMVQLAVAADHVEVETLAVDSDVRGAGVGGRLLAFAEQRARELGLPEVRLCTNRAMTENLAYYPRRGYRETHRETQHGFHRVFFAKPVGRPS
ncbi:GNAT family N-acetyltransferase [Actinoplanes sp. URMC 104]|uniref:GNAT family N-acetyltransferase n=1 Tax=Actinoplanes sp. URMC 104 TaxID=3423409 RepID=UPI003F19E87C